MKIRFDFVTNSSSSSYICFEIDNAELAKAFRQFKVPAQIYGNTVVGRSWQNIGFYCDTGIPGGGSITEWFIELLQEVYF